MWFKTPLMQWHAYVHVETTSAMNFFYIFLPPALLPFVAYATRLHVDTPKRHPFLPYQGFWENKWVIARHQ
jgi:hypothetical protein